MAKTFYALNKSRHSRPTVKLYRKQYNTLNTLNFASVHIKNLYSLVVHQKHCYMTIQIFNYPLETIYIIYRYSPLHIALSTLFFIRK